MKTTRVKKHNRNAENIGKIVRHLEDDGRTDILDNCIITGAVRIEEDDAKYNYKQYVESIRRVLNHHIEMIPRYKKKHPGYKLIFMIFDESASYHIAKDKTDMIDGRIKPALLDADTFHIPCIDEKFFSVIRGEDIDQIIWLAPFKTIFTNIGQQPDCHLMILDPHKDIETSDYNPELIVCREIPKTDMDMPFSFKYADMRVYYIPRNVDKLSYID